MISEDRLRVLHFQLEHKGHTPETMVRMARAGAVPDENGPAIIVTHSELRTLLGAYNEICGNEADVG